MDPLSILASSIALFDGLKEFYRFAEDVIKADSERAEFLQRLDYVAMTKESLDECLASEDNQPDSAWVKRLDSRHTKSSPLVGLVDTMGEMRKLLKEKESGIKKLKNFKWHSEKKTLETFFVTIEGYCNQIMLILSSANMKLSRDTNTTTRAIAASLRKDRDEKREEQERSEQKAIEKWLSPLDFQAQQQEILDTAAEVGKWFVETPAFKCWGEGRLEVLRCYGEAGTGKTTLASIAVDHLAKTLQPSIPALCIFLEKTPSVPQTPKNVLGSLLKQLIQLRAAVTLSIKDAYTKAARINASATSKELEKLLKAELNSGIYDRIHLVVDGLDESSTDTRNYIERDLRKMFQGKLRMLTTSRPDEEPFQGSFQCNKCEEDCIFYHHCKDCPQGMNAGGFDLCEDCAREGGAICARDPAHKLELVNPEVFEYDFDTPPEDMALYVKSLIKEQMPIKLSKNDQSSSKRLTTPFGRYCAEKPEAYTRVVDAIVGYVEGRFQLAKQFTRSLETEQTVRDIKKAVQRIEEDDYNPEELDKLYEKDLNDRIKAQRDRDVTTAMKILSVVACVYRKLNLRELKHALSTEMGESCYDEEYEIDEHDIVRVTKGLVKIDKDGDQIVRLEHQTWYEYFARTRDHWFPRGDLDLGNTCLAYLNFDIFSKTVEVNDLAASLAEKQATHPLISYAVQHWGDHVSKAGAEIETTALKYLEDRNRLAAYIQLAWAADTPENEKWDVRRTIHPLHVCAWFDLSRLMGGLGSSGEDADVKEGTYGQTPLMYACRRGNVQAGRCLLQMGASMNVTSDKGRTALMEAILRISENSNAADYQRSKDMVKLLLKFGSQGFGLKVDVRNPKMHDRTALMIAICRKQEESALAILKYEYEDVGINQQDSEGWTALSLAAYHGLAGVVNACLAHSDISVNLAESKMARGALWLAAAQNQPEIAKTLLTHGAEPELKDVKGRTAVMRAAELGYIDVLRIMFTFPVDVFCKDEDGRSLLHAAAGKGHANVVRLLLEKGLRSNDPDAHGMTPLHAACRSGKIETAQILLDIGADVSQKDQYGRTPPYVAWQYGHSKLVDLCEVHDTKRNLESPEVLKPESLPLWSMVRLHLLDLVTNSISTANSTIPAKEPYTEYSVLHCAICERNEQSKIEVQILREVLSVWHTFLDEPDRHKQTPLHLAACFGDLEATEALLEHDPKLDVVDRFGNTPLAIAHTNEYFDVAVALIEAGADITISKVNLQKMLFAAIDLQKIQAVQNLISAGADRLSQDEYGRTLDMVARSGDAKLLVFLQGVKSFMYQARQRTEVVKTNTEVVTTEVFDFEEAKHIPFRPFQSGPIFLDDEPAYS